MTHSISIVRLFDAPRELVFRVWVSAEDVGTWFAPGGFAVTECELDARPGGRWHVRYESPAGEAYLEHGEFREVVPPERLVLTLTQRDGDGRSAPETVVTVVLAERDGKTEMTFLQTGLTSPETRDALAEGWRGCFDLLDARLTAHPAEDTGKGNTVSTTADEDRYRPAGPRPEAGG
ncbi:SRPBCC family protein [Sphaerisporangium aureirubrum]|uniref:SRPBCC domain-containing protein n=1 Tax=Sphaerisporangium aureirubrum TaxID=1544736 RepID=A0ABW1NG88_9ACTN